MPNERATASVPQSNEKAARLDARIQAVRERANTQREKRAHGATEWDQFGDHGFNDWDDYEEKAF
jgi:hypothetical protein